MINIKEISQLSQKYKVPAETIEKDYMISWLLLSIANSPLSEDFIFYGGTSIKRIYFDDHRYSEDIDLLSYTPYSSDKIISQLACLSYALDNANINFSFEEDTLICANGRTQLYVNYDGFDEIVGAPKKIRLDFVMNSQCYGETNLRNVLASYSDMIDNEASLRTMSLNSILANKIGMLFDATRNEPRDIYDIWFLLNRSSLFDFDVNKIKKEIKEKYSFCPSASMIVSRLTNEVVAKNWKIRLVNQIAKLPDLYFVIKAIEKNIEKIWW